MRQKNKLIFLLYFSIILPFPVSSEEEAEQTEDIVVVASRIPTIASEVIGSVSSINTEQLQVQMIDGLEQLVRYVPGVSAHKESQYGRSLTEDVHIRGIHGGAIFLIDGVRIEFDYGWGLLRASNTQPVIVCRFEADSIENLNKIKNIIFEQIKVHGVNISNEF